MTGTANDDKGVNSLSYWFRDEQQRYLQNDGTVDDIFNSFRGEPDVIGATNATWSYEVTLPHEGIWRGSATATDTIGQADLRSGVRDWRIDSTVVAPTVAISQPVEMTPPFAAPTVTVEPGSRVTFSGTAEDDQGLRNVEITLRNSSTGEGLANDCSFIAGGNGTCRISPVDIGGSVYNWTYTTPFDLTPGTYSFTVRATDDEDNTTSSNNQGRLTINASYPGDNAPNTTMAFVAPTDGSLTVNLAGGATDETGVTNVRVSIQDRDTGRYLQANGTMGATLATREATLGTPNGTTTTWSLPPITLPSGGDWRFSATAYDTRAQFDASPATANYTLYPGDGPPTLSDTLGQPQTGATFDAGKIVVTGRAEDAADQYASIASVQVGVVNAAGQWMSSSRHVHQHQPELPHGVPEQPGQRRIELLVHDAGHPGRGLQRAGAAGRRARPDRCRADLDRHHGHAAVEPAAGPELHLHLQPERLHVRRSWLDGRERELAGLHVELRDVLGLHGQRQRCASDPDLHRSEPRGRTVPGDADGPRRVAGLGHHGSAGGDHRRADEQPAAGSDVHGQLPGPHLRGEQHGHRRPEQRGLGQPTRGTGETARRSARAPARRRTSTRPPGNYTITLTTTDGWGDARLDHPQREPGRAGRQHGRRARRSRPAARRTPPAPSTVRRRWTPRAT